MSKITCEPGRTIHIDGAPAFYLSLSLHSGRRYDYLAPYQVDCLARQLARVMAAGLVKAPDTVADSDRLDRGTPGEDVLAVLTSFVAAYEVSDDVGVRVAYENAQTALARVNK